MESFSVVSYARKSDKKFISDYPGVLRLYKRTFDVPTLDQLYRAEKLYLLRSFGYQCEERIHEDPLKIIAEVEAAVGRCKYFDATKCSIVHRRLLRKKQQEIKKKRHEENQRAWKNGGQARHYINKWVFGNMEHRWFARQLLELTKMDEERIVSANSWEPEEQAPVVARYVRAKWSRTCARSDSAQEGTYVERPKAHRSIMLLFKLRAYIRALRTQGPMALWNAPSVHYKEVKFGSPQMEGLNGENESQVHSSNVVLTETNPASFSTASKPSFSFDWHKLCSTEKDIDYSYLTSRHTFFKSFEWKASQSKESEITESKLDLPCDFVNSVNTSGTMPMFVPFKIHRYFKSDIEVKIHVNSNKFQVGQLQFSWQYLEKYDGNPLNNIYSRSQLPHVLVNAGACNEATLRIPFKYVFPYMFTSQKKNSLLAMYLGTLRCFVVSPLAVGDGGPDKCNVSIFISFPNAQFTGMHDGNIAWPQMEAAAAAMVATAAMNAIQDRNGDNPTNNTNPNYLVPTASHTWSAGTGLREKLHGLRLDHNCIGVGRTGIDPSETSIGIPCRTFGMLRHFEWTSVDASKNKTGYQLYSIDVHPQIEKKLMFKSVEENAMDVYMMPPISVVAGLYKQWRGSLEFRFDIIASQFHTGRLLCAYIPGFYGDSSSITIEQARNSPYVEFSLQDSTSFTFTVPYISNTTFWPRRYTGPHKYSEASAPSKLVIYVLNSLVPMQSVIDHVTIVPYVRAGEDFEVSVPVQPAIGLSDNNSNTYVTKDLISPTKGSYPYYCTKYLGFGSDKYYILYEGGTVTGTASTFNPPAKKIGKEEFYYGKAKNSRSQPICSFKSKDTPKHPVNKLYVGFIVLWYVEGTGHFGIPFPAGEEGEKYAKKLSAALHAGKPVEQCLEYCYEFIEDSTASSADFNQLYFDPIYNTTNWELVQPQMMEQRVESGQIISPTASLPSTSGGMFNFNEKFTDLKDLCRRYQLYGQCNISIKKNYSSDKALVVFPVIPHGLDLDVSDPYSIFNICRDGHIPIVSSGYNFFRGSIRFRLVLSADSPTLGGIKVWVQHHPDSDCGKHQIQVYPNIDLEDSVKSHSYGFYIQALHVNSIIEFEVPFYQPTMYGLTRKPSAMALASDVCQYFSLGNILFGAFTGKVDKGFDFSMQIYYSIGDDFSFSCFRGFPPMASTDEVWTPSEKKNKTKQKEIVWITGEPQMGDAEPEMMKAVASYFFAPVVDEAKTAIVETVSNRVKKEIETAKAKLQDGLKKTNSFIVNAPSVANALGNLLHVLANPTPKTIAISVANVLASILCNSFVQIARLVEALNCVFHEYWQRFTTIANNEAVPQSDFSNNSTSAFCGIVFTAVSALVGVSAGGPKGYPDVMRNINSTVSLANNVIRFVQNSSDLIVYCMNYCSAIINPRAALNAKLLCNAPDVKKWYEECDYLLDVRNKSTYLYDRSMMDRVFSASIAGSILMSNGIDSTHTAGKLIHDTYKDIRKLQNDLFERGAHPDVRYEVYPLWISGTPGIGKSFMVKRLVNDLLKSAHITHKGSLIYDIPSGAKYWDGCTNPLALVSDDLFQVSGQKFEDEISNIFKICSSTVLTPPMAALEDKQRRINPYLYIMLCNSHFPELSPTCRHPEAVYRRRRFLIYADLDETVKEEFEERTGCAFRDASQLDRKITENMLHLKFRYAFNVRDPATTYSEWMSYSDLLDIIKDDFKNHVENEHLNFKQRMIDMYCLDPDFDEMNLIENMPELEFKASLSEQVQFVKDNIKQKLDRMDDPFWDEEYTVREYVKSFINRLKPFSGIPQIGEATPSSSIDSLLEQLGRADEDLVDLYSGNNFKINFPELYENVNKLHNEFNDRFKRNFLDIDFLDASAGVLCMETVGVFELRIQQVINYVFDLEKMDSSYFRQKFSELVSIGKFDSLELLKFIFLLRNGPASVCSIIYAQDEIIFPEAFEMDHGNEHPKEYFTFTSKPDYHNTIKKFNLRHNLEHNVLYVDDRFLFEQTMHLLLASEFKDIIKECLSNSGIRDSQLSTCLGTCLIGATIFIKAYDEYYHFQHFLEHLDICTECNFTKDHYLYPLLQKVIAREFLMSSLIYGYKGKHRCNSHSVWKYACENIQSFTYCSIRNYLHRNTTVVDTCSSDGCVYNNDFSYFLLCLGAFSCKRYTVVENNYLGREDLREYEVCDLLRGVRKRSGRRNISIFSRALNYLKHLLFHSLPNILTAIYNVLLNRLPNVLLALAACTALSFLSIGYARKSISVEPQANYFRFDTPKAPKASIPGRAPTNFVVSQSSTANQKIMFNKITRNTVMVYVTWIDGAVRQTRNCRCLALRSNAMLILRHYWEEYQAVANQGFHLECNLFFKKNNTSDECVRVAVPWEDLQRVAWCSSDAETLTSNYGIVMLPKYVPLFKDIVKYFATEAEHRNVGSVCDIIAVNDTPSFNLPLKVVKNFQVVATPTSSAVYMTRAYEYSRQCSGLCGSIVFCNSLGSGMGAIIGMHVAGRNTGDGYAEPLYRETFQAFFNEVQTVEPMPIPTTTEIEPNIKLDTNLLMYGCVPPKFAHKESGKTKITPSLVHAAVYPVRTEVNPLKPNDPRQPPGSHPLRDGCEKHGTGNIVPFSPEKVDSVIEHLSDTFIQVVRPVRAEVQPLSLEQAICGDVNVPYFESLNWKSSEGFPLSSYRPKGVHDKRWLFDLEEGQFGYKLKGIRPELELQLKLRDECFKKKIKPPTVYVDCLKDYRLTPEKCAQPGKTRIFSIAPIQCSIDIRMYLNDFCASIKNTRIKNSIAIGINPDSYEWTDLVNYLFEVGDKIITLDYSNYGPCLMSQLVVAGNNVIKNWFQHNNASTEHVNRVEWLLDNDIVNPVHLCDNVVYQTVNGIASGSPLTGECNSIPNLFYIRLTYLEIMEKIDRKLANMTEFDNNVRLVVYGDDLIMSVSDQIISHFNALSIRDALALHGIRVTPAQKSAEMVPYTSIYDATFLKRSFRQHPFRSGIWLAPIDKASIEECINWCHVSENPQEATLESCRASLDLAYSQGPDYYEEHYKKIRTALNNLGLKIEYKSWFTRDMDIFEEQGNPEFPKKISCNLPWTYDLSNHSLTL
ncbi:polyprotein [Exitianus exitiosus virus 1]|nr:polyprotein [Exitianus exitiosus virus 1]